MTASCLVTALEFRRAAPRLVKRGVLGFVSLVIAETMCVHQVAVRRTSEGRIVLSYKLIPRRPLRGPARDLRGDESMYALTHPLTPEAHAEIERQVVAQLRERGEIP